MVSCLYDHARCNEGQNLKEEEDHLTKAFMENGYPRPFICSASEARAPKEDDGEREKENPPSVHLSYIHVTGISERIKMVCKDFNIRAVFKSGPTLLLLLTKVKDPLPTEKQANVVYDSEVLCTCGKVYISGTMHRLELLL